MNRKPQGFALIDLVFVCGIIGLLASIALPRLTLAKSAAGAASAMGTLRAITSANSRSPSLAELGSMRRICRRWGSRLREATSHSSPRDSAALTR